MTVLPAVRAVGPCVRGRRLWAVCFSGVCTVCLMVCVSPMSPPHPHPHPPPRGRHAGLEFQARRSPLSSFWLNGNKKQRGEVGGWGAWLSPQARREPGAGGRRRRGSASGGGRRRETGARREGQSFRPRSWRLRSFRRAGRRQSQANTAPAWARGGAAAGGGARARCGPWGETESGRRRGGRRKVTGGGCAAEYGLL